MTTTQGQDLAASSNPPGRPGTGQAMAPRRAGGLALCAALIAVPILAACGSGPGSGSSAASGSAAAVTATICTQVAGALADGPDPDTDPVGYAQAQILPLRDVKTSDAALQAAVSKLASAYAQVVASKGKSTTATQALTAASKKIDAICPGVTS